MTIFNPCSAWASASSSAVFQNTPLDRIAMFITLTGISVPVFWYALIAILLVIFQWRWVPQTGLGDGSLRYYLLPAFVLGTRAAAFIARITRSTMLEIIRQDFIRTARAKGLSERPGHHQTRFSQRAHPRRDRRRPRLSRLYRRRLFNRVRLQHSGHGPLRPRSRLLNRDLPVMIPLVIYTATLFIVANLLVDLLYAIIDPRIRYD